MVKYSIGKDDAMSNEQKLFERASTDADFRAHLLADPAAVLRTNGLSLPAGAKIDLIDVQPNELHINLGLSGGPSPLRSLIDRARDDVAFRRQLLESPRSVIQQTAGVDIPADTEIRVHEAAPKGVVRFFVPPLKTAGSGELSDADLEAVAGGGFFKNVMSGLREWLCKDTHAVEINDQNNSYQIMTDTSNKAPTNEVGSLIVW